MYLARIQTGPRSFHFVLRESRVKDGVLSFRDLAELGPDPGRYVVYSGGCSFHLDENLLDRLRARGVTGSYEQLEDLFFPYIDPYIKQRLQPFRDRDKYRRWRPAAPELRRRALAETHPFDRRRLLFLRMGRTAAETVDRTAALFTSLLDKSRDEIEQMILAQEQALPPREYPHYLFAIFDLQRYFPQSYARSIPQALNAERVDTLFVEEICRLSEDPVFWRGFPLGDRLPAYLLRYLFMYFDVAPQQSTGWARFARAGRTRRFERGRTADPARMSRSQAVTLFGLSAEQLAQLSKKELTRLYRRKALELHPDKGGDAEQFIRLTMAYEALLPSLP